jgi:hypothetical protein
VVLYVDGFGRFEGNVVRCDDGGFGLAFVCTPPSANAPPNS